jgi:DNA-binding NarL/FixJ family response regulator
VTGEVIRTGKAVALADASADARSAQPTVRAGGVRPLVVLEDRERIATELHDGAIQSLFAVGMGLQGSGSGSPSPADPALEPARRYWDDAVMSAPPLRVMLVDDHQVVRDGIRLLLNEATDVVLCAEASSAREAVATAARALPDVIVMDVRLQDGSGIEATRDIRAARPTTQVLMLTSFADDEALFASIMAGAAGYVLKHLLRDERLARLSPQEERILALVAEGRTNGQIGAELGLAEKTVKNYGQR